MPRSRVHDGVVFRRKESRVWWIRYRDRNGVRRRESTPARKTGMKRRRDSETGFRPETTTYLMS